MWTVSSGSSSGNTLERRVAGRSFFFSSRLSSRMGTSSSLSSGGIETLQRVRSLASTPLKVSVFFSLIATLRSSTVPLEGILTEGSRLSFDHTKDVENGHGSRMVWWIVLKLKDKSAVYKS